MEYYSAVTKKEVMPFVVTWMDLEIIILSEISQAENNKYHDVTYMCNLERKDTNELTYKIDSQTLKLMVTKVKVKVAQSCPTLCTPMDYTVHEILQARILEWVAFPIFRGSSPPRNQTQVSHIADGFFTS